jgi:DNA-binding LacI/PurR family transcriptional regulator
MNLAPTTRSVPQRNKQPLVMDEIVRLAKSLGPGIKLPTAQELSRRIGVTVTTLDRSLAKLEARGVIFRRQGSGIYAAARLFEKRVAVVLGHNIFHPANSPIYSLLFRHCQARAVKGNERFSFYLDLPLMNDGPSDGSAHRDIQEAMEEKRIDGVLLIQKHNNEHEVWLRSHGVPVVALSSDLKGPGVKIDMRQIIDLAMATLVERGCRSVGLIGIAASQGAFFKEAARKYGVITDPRWVICPPPGCFPPFDVHKAFGRKSARTLLSRCGRDGLPDGLIIPDDIIASGACGRFAAEGIHSTKQLQIAVLANKGSSTLADWQESLILIELDPLEVVEAMFSLLESLMARQPCNEAVRWIGARLVQPQPVDDDMESVEDFMGFPASEHDSVISSGMPAS